MEHDWDDQPYGTTGLKYYVSTGISGSSSVLCNNSTRSFSARNIPDADYDWEVGPGITLNDDGEYSTSVTTGSFSGETWIEVEITSPLGGDNDDVKTSKRIIFWVGKPSFSGIELGVLCSEPPHEDVCIDQIVPVGVVDTNAVAQGVTGYHWLFGSWDSYVMGYENTGVYTDAVALLMLDDYALEMQIVGVSAENTCGIGSPQSKDLYAVECGGGWYMSMYPNPASDYVTVSFVETDEVRSEEGKVMIEDKNYRDKELKEYTIEIWDEKRGVVKRVTSKEKYLQIPVNDLASGRYYFHLIYNGKTYKQQLIVE